MPLQTLSHGLAQWVEKRFGGYRQVFSVPPCGVLAQE